MSIITRPQNADYDVGYERTFTSKTVDPVCRGCGQKRWLVSYDHSYRTLTCKRCKLVCVEVKSHRPGVYEFKDQYPLELVPLPSTPEERGQRGAFADLFGDLFSCRPRPLEGGEALAGAYGQFSKDVAAARPLAQEEPLEVKTTKFTRLPPGPEPKPGPTVQVTCKGCGELEDSCRCCPNCMEYPCSCSLLALQEKP